MNSVSVDAFSEVSTDGAGVCFLGVGGAHQFAVLGNGAFAFQNLYEYRTGNHEVDQILEERTLGVHAVEALGFATGQVNQATSDHFQASAFKAGNNLTDHVFSNSVGLDNGQSAFNSHVKIQIRTI
ncbi:hypothetical protein C660_05017 [Alcaligenes sp. HPC1271]|nr:hypothetical protein C660_05017 [Alcaligenes sp. HPC1271]